MTRESRPKKGDVLELKRALMELKRALMELKRALNVFSAPRFLPFQVPPTCRNRRSKLKDECPRFSVLPGASIGAQTRYSRALNRSLLPGL